ncbi:MAG TPA: hypothetical protein VHC47_09175, partial [Mucilaginibacter sp.]|nr:hypothetical protein [Mucilaginibacter sp.]
MSRNLLYALSALILFAGCRRDESHLNKPCTSGCAVFNIRIGTGDSSAYPVSGAHVDLVWQGPNGIFGGGGKSIDIAKGYTDAQGMINVKFKAADNEFTDGYFIIEATGPVNYFASSQTLFNIRNADTTLNTSVQLPFKAYVRIVLKNFDPKTPDDSFAVLPTFKAYGSTVTDPSFATSPAGILYHTGQSAPFDSVVYKGPTAGNQYTYFSVVIHRNGTQ